MPPSPAVGHSAFYPPPPVNTPLDGYIINSIKISNQVRYLM